MLRKRKQMNRIYPGLLHCFAVRNDAVGLKYRTRHCELRSSEAIQT